MTIHLSKRFPRRQWAAAEHASARARPTTPSLGQVLGIASLVLRGRRHEQASCVLLGAVSDRALPLGARVIGSARRWLACGRAPTRGAGAATPARRRLARATRRCSSSIRRRRRCVRAADTLRGAHGRRQYRRRGSIAFARFPLLRTAARPYRSIVYRPSVRMPRQPRQGSRHLSSSSGAMELEPRLRPGDGARRRGLGDPRRATVDAWRSATLPGM
jgi:hypothetical protein